MNKRKRTVPAQDNPIIAALRRSFPDGCNILFEVDSRPDRKRDLFIALTFKDAIPEIGFLVVKALLKGDRQLVRDIKRALIEVDHFLGRHREKALYKKAVKILPELRGLGDKDRKELVEKRCNNGKELHPQQWNRLKKALCLPIRHRS